MSADNGLVLVDSHCHLDFDELEPDFEDVLARARAAGVCRFVNIGIQVSRHQHALQRTQHHGDIFHSVGTHPHWAAEENDVTVEQLIALAAHPKVIGIGEVGLDRILTDAPWDAQMRNLLVHIDAARHTQLPLIIHSVGEDQEMEATLRRTDAEGRFPVVMHCFSGGWDLARANLELGHYISFSGLLTHDGREALHEIAATLPADRILLETDAPSLAPKPFESQRNEPAHIVHTLDFLARLRGVSRAALAAQTTENFFRVFKKAPRPHVS
ncbi:deoxyribonuclease TatD [Acetobacter nitrogenifigens DSM 23921 = NBRC 105050]|uniref:LuxR family transcriptional regulator n=1 Tax=Acetobacter nitrogenifigens DSM 23921 = NBRC 105050 TaxID=1120919 RepID=A0A511XC27_9PROT|nr:TatD family hydrolase [Acetobacter nitrogenifigens]GBQ88878.1 deoxyribonuclease TatD [Acetobacter nitrogenifigens DSM 23921 = NBRC 105050]GEN60516.1 LuxR family transcriptional regulator [Acetobacter nitrogenifigens DSM 23921 = NBRC 105050]